MTPLPYAPTVPELAAANREANRRGLAPHGTEAAHRRHLRHREVPCQACCDAHAAKQRAWVRRKQLGDAPAGPVKTHGNTGGYRAHKLRGEEACDECLEAWRAYQRDWHARKRRTREAPC